MVYIKIIIIIIIIIIDGIAKNYFVSGSSIGIVHAQWI